MARGKIKDPVCPGLLKGLSIFQEIVDFILVDGSDLWHFLGNCLTVQIHKPFFVFIYYIKKSFLIL